jgi:hypothetical protein
MIADLGTIDPLIVPLTYQYEMKYGELVEALSFMMKYSVYISFVSGFKRCA